jgi:NAD-dependent DNA ligase
MLSFEKLSKDPIPYLESHTLDKAVKLLKEASFQYYKGTPVIADDIFDILKTYIENKDPKNPVLDEIGAETVGEKVKLPFWMGSLDKIREERGEKAGFDKAIESWKSKHSGNVVISDKLDGNSALLVYSPKGIKMYSRGDGHQGQDISHLVPLIKGLPKKLPFPNYAVRGELIISKDNWKKGGKGANARNAVAGVMHSKHPDKELASIVEFVAYEQLQPRASASDGIEVMGELGFKVVYNTSLATEKITIESLSKILIDRRANSPYEVDGIVIFHDSDHNQVVGKNPSYAFAFKSILTHEEAEVIVKEVTWAASKDGYLKPLIHFEPVVLAGASIQKATGFNAQYIETNTIGPGSRIVIIRSGDVIPHVVRILTKSATGKPSFPENCKYKWNDTHIDIVLEDKSSAEDVIVKRMTYFAKTLDMKGVGEGVIQRLYNNGIDSIKKMLNMKVDELIKIEGFQKKSAEKVVNEIREAVSRADCLTFMDASNLFGRAIGEKKLKLIVTKFPKILEGDVPKEKELSNIDGIGPLTAKQFLDGLPEFFDFMKDIGIPCNKVLAVNKVVSTKPSLSSLTVVFTGMRDKELESEIEARGGKIASAVSKKTTVVVAKDPSDESGKVKTAKELGIRVVNFETFKKSIFSI